MSAREQVNHGKPPPSWLGCTFDLPAGFDSRAFAAALCGWMDRHEILRSHLTPVASPTTSSNLQRMTLPTGGASVHPSAAGEFADARELARYLENLFDSEAGPLAWPGYVFTSIANSTATTVCLALDHTLVDGYSLFQTPHEIHMLYAAARAATDGHAIAALSHAPSYLDFAEAERTAANALTLDHHCILRWQQFVAKGKGSLPAFPVPVSNPNGAPAAQPSGYDELLDASAARAFEHVCRSAGGDSFSGLLACFAKASQEIANACEFGTMVPFHTHIGPRRSSLGWYVGMGPVSFPLDASESFDQTVRSVVSALDGVKELAQVPVLRVMELLGQPLRDPFMLSYMDLRLVVGARKWNAWNAAFLRSRSDDPDEVCLWILRTHDGLSISYRHPANDVARAVVPDYVARTKRMLDRIAHPVH
jgi:hypothetical protein